MLRMRQIRLKTAEAKLQYHQLKVSKLLQSFRPSFQMPVTVINDNGRWVCKFECSHDPMENVIAYGESPEQACHNFDALWNGEMPIINDHYEEEENF